MKPGDVGHSAMGRGTQRHGTWGTAPGDDTSQVFVQQLPGEAPSRYAEFHESPGVI